ncbi:MAG: SpoIID/LytB domain-containing protein [Chloroflexota bacterium]
MNDYGRRRFRLPDFRTGWWIYAAAAAGVLALVLIIRSLTPGPQLQPAPKLHGPVPEPTISLYRTKTGTKEYLKVDDYIAGVVAGEIEPTWPREALAAQAIVARTFVMQKYESGFKTEQGTNASDDHTTFQAYDPALINDNVRAAVAATRGQVLTYDGKLILAYFHSSSGGITATAAEGGLDTGNAPTPYLTPVKDPPGPDPKEENWSKSFSVSQIAQAAGMSSFSKIDYGEKGPSGRVLTFLLDGKPVKATTLRAALDPTHGFRSTLITDMRLEGGRVYFAGKGWGHGVGMSQQGARNRALAGQTAAEIVQYYYPGARVEQLWK